MLYFICGYVQKKKKDIELRHVWELNGILPQRLTRS